MIVWPIARYDPPPKHVLIMDDAIATRLLVREILEEGGYRTSLAPATLDPDAITQIAPDVLILDPMVGRGEDGWGLLRRLREDPATARLPVVVCTGAVQRVRDEMESLATPDTELVLKPFDIDELLDAVDALTRDAESPAGRDIAQIGD